MSYLDFLFLKRTNHILLSPPLYFYVFPLYTMVLFSLLYSIDYFKGSMMAEYVSYGSIFAFFNSDAVMVSIMFLANTV